MQAQPVCSLSAHNTGMVVLVIVCKTLLVFVVNFVVFTRLYFYSFTQCFPVGQMFLLELP